MKITKKIGLIISLIFLLTITACSSDYVCPDGTVVDDPQKCETTPQPVIRDIQAERTVDNYASAYARALGVTHSRINTYRHEGNWHSVVLFTDTREGKVNTVTFEIDGVTATVNCYDGCEYLEREEIDDVEEEIEQNEETNTSSGFSVY